LILAKKAFEWLTEKQATYQAK